MVKNKKFIIFSIILFFFLWIFPISKYEWMIDEVEYLPVDNNSEVYSIIALIPILFLIIYSLFRIKTNKYNLIICFILIVYWFLKFFICND